MARSVKEMADNYEEQTSSNYTTPDKPTSTLRYCPLIDEEKWNTLTGRSFTLLNAQKNSDHLHQLQATHNKLTFVQQMQDERLDVLWTIVRFSDESVQAFIGEYFIYKVCGSIHFLRPISNLAKYSNNFLPTSKQQTIQTRHLTQHTDSIQQHPTSQQNTDSNDDLDREITFKNMSQTHIQESQHTPSTDDGSSSTQSFQNGQRLTQPMDDPIHPQPPSSHTSTSQSLNLLDPIARAMSVSNITNIDTDKATTPQNTQGPQHLAAQALQKKTKK